MKKSVTCVQKWRTDSKLWWMKSTVNMYFLSRAQVVFTVSLQLNAPPLWSVWCTAVVSHIWRRFLSLSFKNLTTKGYIHLSCSLHSISGNFPPLSSCHRPIPPKRLTPGKQQNQALLLLKLLFFVNVNTHRHFTWTGYHSRKLYLLPNMEKVTNMQEIRSYVHTIPLTLEAN